MHSHWRSLLEWENEGLYMQTASDEACKLFDAAVTQYVGWYDDPSMGGLEATIQKLKAADPTFVMGHVVAVGLELLGTGRTTKLDTALQADVNNMRRLINSGKFYSVREQLHVEALDFWAKGSTEQACEVWEELLQQYPTDILALKFAHDTYFYLGESNQIRDSIARVLPEWKPTMPLYGYVLGMHSFGLEETNLYPEAEAVARKALSINPKDAWATHTLCHVMEMTGRQHEGIYMLDKTSPYWTSCGMLACHNYWHWSLYYIELGDYESALSLFDKEISRRAKLSGSMLDIVDVCSFLYRLEMEEVDIGNRWDDVFKLCKSHLHDHVLVFNDLHFLLSCLGAKQEQAVSELMKSIEEFVRSGQGTNKEVTAEVGEALLKGFIDYNNGYFSQAVNHVAPIRHKVHRIGGSHAQRDLVNLFLINASIRSHKKAHNRLSRALLNERKLRKLNSPLTDRIIEGVKGLHDY